jgi:TonB family protein
MLISSNLFFEVQVNAQQPVPSANPLLQPSTPCSDEVAKWWREVLQAGDEAVYASKMRQQSVEAALRNNRFKATDLDILPKKERDQLDAKVSAARTHLQELLKMSEGKSWQPPIADLRRPVFLYLGKPYYTEEARAKRISGEVKIRMVFNADGTIGEIKILSSLGSGLDEKAVEAAQRIVFIPATIEGKFVPITIPLEMTFNLR